uniref:Structural maintenance of chromosomes 6 n=1 Tax=Vombatus ursinus TaxID=29139 RepID=A0A4X2L4U0_VOMUR
MAERKGEKFPPSAARGQQRARAGPERDSNKGRQRVSAGSYASQSISGEIGIIESIQLENFMCYAVLGPLKFGANINLVVGCRSKSALLSAIVICFGGKSLGICLRDFVKEGAASANISITLRNRGDYAFKPDRYGESITVQQCISMDIDPCYQLKDQAGNVVSCEEEELADILDHFQIRVDNPVAILQKEISSQLLQIRDDSGRYQLFLKATKLEQMKKEYSELMDKKVRYQEELDQGKEELEKLKSQSKMLENHFENMVALTEKLEVLQHEMAWAIVSEGERDLVEMTNNVSVGSQLTVTLNQELEASKAKFVEAEKKQRTICENIQKLNADAAALEPRLAEAKEKAERSDRAHIQAEAFCNFSQNEMNRLESVAEKLQNQIEDLKKSQKLAELDKLSKVSMLKEQLKSLREQGESFFRDIKHVHQIVEKGDEEHYRCKKEEASIQQMLNEDQTLLDQLKEYKSEPLKRYGPQVPALVEAIEDAYMEGLFHFKPLGPLGTCIRLRDPEFALAVECCLRGLLHAFFCDNQEDEQVLQELMKKFYPSGFSRPQIIIAAFECELYDVRERAAYHPEFPTVLTTLEISRAVVANTLIDMRRVESVLLVKSSALAHTVMRGQGPPKNCSRILTASGDEVYEGCYSSCEESRPTYLGDVEIELSNLEKGIENKKAQLAAYQQHMCSLERDIKKNRETVEIRYHYLKETRFKEINITSEMKDLENENENQSTELSFLEKEAQETKEKIKEAEKKLKTRKEEMENLEQLRIVDNQRYDEVKLKCNEVSNLAHSLRGEQNQAALEVDTQRKSVLHCESRLREHLNSLQERKEEVAMKKRELQREVALAKYICPERIDVTRTASFLDNEIDVLKQTVQSENYIYGSQEEIKRQLQQAKERCVELAEELKDLKKVLTTLDEKSTHRFVMYKKHRRSLSLQCKLYFQNLLSQSSFWGEICFDHENETLSLSVQTAEENTAAFSGMEVISGDIHSFSNFLFMTSLWSITESPFRCLDSFDTYMNSDHTKIAMDMILKIAHSQQHSQFILIIPEYMSSLPSSSLIEILQISDPEGCDEAMPLQSDSSEEEKD